MNACWEAASLSIPRSSRSKGDRCSAVLPGWNEHVAPLRDKSVLWHDIWVSCGRPHDGLVASIMRRTRATYHYAVRYIKRNSQDIIKDRFASTILENRDHDFGVELRKLAEAYPDPRAYSTVFLSLPILQTYSLDSTRNSIAVSVTTYPKWELYSTR